MRRAFDSLSEFVYTWLSADVDEPRRMIMEKLDEISGADEDTRLSLAASLSEYVRAFKGSARTEELLKVVALYFLKGRYPEARMVVEDLNREGVLYLSNFFKCRPFVIRECNVVELFSNPSYVTAIKRATAFALRTARHEADLLQLSNLAQHPSRQTVEEFQSTAPKWLKLQLNQICKLVDKDEPASMETLGSALDEIRRRERQRLPQPSGTNLFEPLIPRY